MSDSDNELDNGDVYHIASKNHQKINALIKVNKIENIFGTVVPLDIDDYGTSNQPFGYNETFACAYKRCLVGVEHLKKNGITNGFVIALENGQYIDRDYNVNIGYDFCACVAIDFGKKMTIYSSYKMPNVVKVPVCKEYLDEVMKQGTVHYTEINGIEYKTGFDMTIGSLYEKYRGMNKRDWMADSCGVTRESQLVSSLTYTASGSPGTNFDPILAKIERRQ